MRLPSTSTKTSARRAIFVPSGSVTVCTWTTGAPGGCAASAGTYRSMSSSAGVDQMRANALERLLRCDGIGQQAGTIRRRRSRPHSGTAGSASTTSCRKIDVASPAAARRASQLAIIARRRVDAMDVDPALAAAAGAADPIPPWLRAPDRHRAADARHTRRPRRRRRAACRRRRKACRGGRTRPSDFAVGMATPALCPDSPESRAAFAAVELAGYSCSHGRPSLRQPEMRSAMMVVVERPLEAVEHVVDVGEARLLERDARRRSSGGRCGRSARPGGSCSRPSSPGRRSAD